MHAAPARSFRVLTPEQARQFIADGWVRIDEVVPRELAARIEPLFWKYLTEKRDDPSTWTQEGVLLKSNIVDEPAPAIASERYRAAVDDLVGVGRGQVWPQLGYAPIRFPGFSRPPWRATGWHVDGNFFHHHLTSREQGLVGVDLFTDIEPGGGGTAIRVGSHRVVARLLAAAEPAGIPAHDLSRLAEEATRHLPVIELTGCAGDAILMHPHLVHGSSTNLSTRVRVASNRCVPLEQPMQLERDDPSQYSLVELAIREALADP